MEGSGGLQEFLCGLQGSTAFCQLTSAGCTLGGRSSTVRQSGLGMTDDSEDAIKSSMVGRNRFPSAPT